MRRLNTAAGRHALRGATLLEALIALAVLGLALLGMLWGQLRTLASSSDSLRRSQAILLIDDLTERMRANPVPLAQLENFRSDWGTTADDSVDCASRWCDATALARWDLARWRQAVYRQLPSGGAAVYRLQGDSSKAGTRLGVMIGWRAAGAAPPVAAPNPMQEPGRPDCPQGWTCHYAVVQP